MNVQQPLFLQTLEYEKTETFRLPQLNETSGIRTPDNLIKRHFTRRYFVSKDDLIKEIYLRVSDETDMGDLVKEEDFVAVVRRVLYDYALVSEANIVH